MEVLGLDVKREHVCQKHSEGGRNILGGIGAEIARRVEWCLAALSRVLDTHFDLSFRNRSSAIAVLDPEIDWTMLLENDLAMLAREITSRHRVDRRSLLPLAPRRNAVARNATSRVAGRNRPVTLQRSLSRAPSGGDRRRQAEEWLHR